MMKMNRKKVAKETWKKEMKREWREMRKNKEKEENYR